MFIAQILMRMKSNKLIKIKGFELQLEMWFDFDPIIEKFPKLEKFSNKCLQNISIFRLLQRTG